MRCAIRSPAITDPHVPSASATHAAHVRAVADLLVAYGRELELEGAAQVGGSFTGRPEADEFLISDPNAFLIGILFTQGIPAERAWAGPWELRERLGYWDMVRLSREQDSVTDAFQRPPMLHRFKNTMPGWVSEAALRLVSEWDGDASNIWAEGTHVLEVTRRLSEFTGIGRKKAVMAVQILTRHFGVRLTGAECGSVAYDVHVRRVFLRTGLAEEDSPDAMDAAAARACPSSPGTLDLPAWLIGRQRCRPTAPLCETCLLSDVCARRLEFNPVGVPGART